MLRFFRIIRKSLIENDQMKKYTLYAIGEIALVVLGILIALQINQWNQNRVDRIQEQQILAQLIEEFEDNKQQLESKIYVRDGLIQSALRIIDHMDTKGAMETDTLNHLLAMTIFRPTFDPASGVTNELLASGKLYLIQNQELRILLTNWSGKFLGELREEEEYVVDYIRLHYYPFLVDHFQVRNFFANAASNEFSRLLHFDSSDNRSSPITQSSIRNKPKDILSIVDLEDHLISMIGFSNSANKQSMGVMEIIDRILELAQAELKS